ncbi:MAG: response regulator, partial [Leptonema sp. (in: Bacteria)]|nr:response regulator [Leptonema sp. (in: bacteria)]
MTQNKKISVLIVDDSITYRQFLRDALSTNDQIEVVSIASNGLLALPRVRHYKPDFIILDHEMPELTGIETLKEIRRIHPSSKVIMFSSHTTEGARVTIQALNNGAVAFVTKPNGSGESPVTYIQRELLTLILEIAAQEKSKQEKSQTNEILQTALTKEVDKSAQVTRHTLSASALPGSFDVAAIGISTGGP